MQFQFFNPQPVLAPYIQQYWIMESSGIEEKVTERVIPTGNVQLMFHYGNPFCANNALKEENQQPRSLVSGLTTHFFDASTQGKTGVLAVVFHPLGACNFFRFSMSELEDLTLNLDDVFHNEMAEIEEQLFLANSNHTRVQIIESFLMKKIGLRPAHDLALMQKAFREINNHRAQISTAELSSLLAMTPRNLERKFAALVGKSPKQFIRLTRFQHIVNDLRKCNQTNLTDFAFRFGYFDQSHFIRDFKELSGYTPGEFIGVCKSY
jgi:AraC-like DNA-binding protein